MFFFSKIVDFLMYLYIWICVCEWKTCKTIIENPVIAVELFDGKNVWDEIKMLREQKNRSSGNCECNMKYCRYKRRPCLQLNDPYMRAYCKVTGLNYFPKHQIIFLGRTWSGQQLFSILIFAEQNRILQEW